MSRQYYEIQAQVLGQWTTDVIGENNQFDSEAEAEAALENLLETNPSWAVGEDNEARGYRVRTRRVHLMARDTQINLRVSGEESADLADAAADAGMSLSEWARLVLLYAAGRPISEQLDRAAEVGRKLVSAALSELSAGDVKRAVKGARKRKVAP
jgi:hypothetical protein